MSTTNLDFLIDMLKILIANSYKHFCLRKLKRDIFYKRIEEEDIKSNSALDFLNTSVKIEINIIMPTIEWITSLNENK